MAPVPRPEPPLMASEGRGQGEKGGDTSTTGKKDRGEKRREERV